MKQVYDLHARILLVEFLVLGPPLPRHAVSQLGKFLAHGPAIIECPLCLLLVGHVVRVHADAFIEGLLHAEKFAELIGRFHDRSMPLRGQAAR